MTDHLLERLEHQEGMLRRDPSRHHLHAADAMRDARAELTRLRERERRLEGVLLHAEHFIANGIEFGFIRMPDPDTPDPAHETVPAIRAALSDTAAPTPEEVERG